MPTDRLARKINAEAETVAPRPSDMMLPVSVMKVMPTDNAADEMRWR